MTAVQDAFKIGCEFQGVYEYKFHSAPGVATDYWLPKQMDGTRTALFCGLDPYIQTRLPNNPFCAYRYGATRSGYQVVKGSGTLSSGNQFMGGDVSIAVEILCKWYDNASLGDTHWVGLNTTYDPTGTCNLYTSIFASKLTRLHMRDSGNTERTLTEGSAGADNTWHHFVGVCQAGTGGSPGIWKIYRNGVQTASASWTYGNFIAPNNYWLCFLPSNSAYGVGEAMCRMRFFRYYSMATASPFLQADIDELYNSGNWRDVDYVNPNWRRNIQTKIDINVGTATGSAYKWRDG